MSVALRDDPQVATARTLKRLRTIRAMRIQDRGRPHRMDLHRREADYLLDQLLTLHPERRSDR